MLLKSVRSNLLNLNSKRILSKQCVVNIEAGCAVPKYNGCTVVEYLINYT